MTKVAELHASGADGQQKADPDEQDQDRSSPDNAIDYVIDANDYIHSASPFICNQNPKRILPYIEPSFNHVPHLFLSITLLTRLM